MAINIRTENTNGRSSTTCTFCRGIHSISSCPKINEYAIEGAKFPFSERTFRQHYAMQYVELKSNRSAKRKASAKRCGYCKGSGHSRRNCTLMEEHREFLNKANRVWRKIYAIKSVELGFAPASLIKYEEQMGYNYGSGTYDREEKMYLIGSELPTNLSVFALATDHNLKQVIKIPAVGRNRPFSFRQLTTDTDCEKPLGGGGYYYNDGKRGAKVITKSTYQYSDEWINGHCDDIDFVLKKWDKDRIERDILSSIRKRLIPYASQMGLW
jgi:hypothetical protein